MRVILNDDCSWFWDYYAETHPERAPTRELPREYVRQYKGTGMTDYFVNINGQYSFTPSEVMETSEDSYNRDFLGDLPVNFKDIPRYKVCHEHVIRGIDIYGEMIDECNRIGISPWISIRMNDVHTTRKSSPDGGGLRSLFLHTAHEKGLMRDSHRDIFGYYDETLDYSKKEVRDLFLGYIREQLLRYDVAGVELDFMREVYCFRAGYEDEGREIMRSFMKEVRGYCKEAETKHGHPVKIAVRCLTDPLNDRYSGLYALGLAREGLVDWLIPSPRWETSYDRVPIDMWRELVPEGCLVMASYEIAHNSSSRIRQRRSDEQLLGMWHKDLAMGADGIYLFNNIYLYVPKGLISNEHQELYRLISSPERVAKAKRRCTLSYQDVCAPGGQCLTQLPLRLGTLNYNYLYFETGPEAKPQYVLFDGANEPSDVEVYANSADVKYVGKTYVEKSYTESPVLVYELTANRPMTQAVEIKPKRADITVTFAEVRNYKPTII